MHNNCSVLFTPGKERETETKKSPNKRTHCKHGRMQRDKPESRKSCIFFWLLLESRFSMLQVYSCVWFTFCTQGILFTCNFCICHLPLACPFFTTYFFRLLSLLYDTIDDTNRKTWMNFNVFTRSFLFHFENGPLHFQIFRNVSTKLKFCIWFLLNAQRQHIVFTMFWTAVCHKYKFYERISCIYCTKWRK